MHGLAYPIQFAISGYEANGFLATILPKKWRAVLGARREGTLDHQKPALVAKCEILIQCLAIVGIRGLWMRQQDTSISERHVPTRTHLKIFRQRASALDKDVPF